MKYYITHYPVGSKGTQDRVKKSFPYTPDGKQQKNLYLEELKAQGFTPIEKVK